MPQDPSVRNAPLLSLEIWEMTPLGDFLYQMLHSVISIAGKAPVFDF